MASIQQSSSSVPNCASEGQTISATLLTLFVLPVLYTFLAPRSSRQRTAADLIEEAPR